MLIGVAISQFIATQNNFYTTITLLIYKINEKFQSRIGTS